MLTCVLTGFSESLRSNLSRLQAPLTGMTDAYQDVPIVGPHLSELAETRRFDGSGLQAINSALSGVDPLNTGAVHAGLYGALGPGGLGLFTATNQLTVAADAVNCTVTVDLNFHQDVADIELPSNAKFDMGLDALAFKFEATGGVLVDVAFQEHAQFVFREAAAPTFTADAMSLNVTASLDPGTELEAIIGFIPVTISDGGTPAAPTRLQAQLSGTNVLATPTFTFVGSADVYLDAAARIDSTRFPGVSTGIEMHWSYDSNSPAANPPTVEFKDVHLNMGSAFSSVLGPIVEVVVAATEPLQPLIDLIKAPVPVLTDLSHAIGEGDVTLQGIIDLANAGGAFGGYGPLVTLISTLVDITNVIKDIDESDGLEISVGSFDLGSNGDLRTLPAAIGLGIAGNGNLTNLIPRGLHGLNDIPSAIQSLNTQLDAVIHDPNVNADLKSSAENVKQFISRWGNGAELKFPIIDNPVGALFPLLLGVDRNLIEFRAQFVGAGEMDQDFGFGPAGVKMTGAVQVDGLFEMAFDTFGMRQFLVDPNHDLGLIGNGLYINNQSHLSLTGKYSATVFVPTPLPIVEIGGTGSISYGLDFHLSDPSPFDGKLRWQELNPSCVFQVGGRADASLGVFFRVGVDIPIIGFVGLEKEFDIADVNIFKFDVECLGLSSEPPPPAISGDPTTGLGQVAPDGTLTLFMGPHASLRTGSE
ncbi:MAG: hypothetical protein KDA60_01565, partial [Planctomycetales bacterium]|nr:hypothetical protein [Planctomycetales bacterium]